MRDYTLLDRFKDLLRSRRFRWILTIVCGVLVVLYFLFVTFLFNPFEEDLGDTAEIVPRQVDYFFRWRGAADRFGEFPQPAIWADFEGSELYQRLQGTGRLNRLDQELGVTEMLSDLEQVPSELPAGVSLKGDLLREVALAGRGEPRLGSGFDGVLMLRVSFKIKAAVSLLDFGFVRNKLPESVAVVDEGDDLYRLPQFGLFGGQDAWLARIRDVVLLASDREWIDQARDLNIRAGEGSLGPSSVFHDNVTDHLTPGDQPIEAFVRWDRLGSRYGRWPDAGPGSPFAYRLWNRFLDSDLVHTLAGYWRPGMRFEGRLTGAVDLDQAGDFMKRWYESQPLRKLRIEEFADWVPGDSFFFAGLAGNPSRVLVEMAQALDEEQRRFFDEILINSGKYQGVAHILSEMGSILSPGLFIAMRRNQYEAREGKDVEQHDDVPVPVFVLMAQIRDAAAEEKYEEILTWFKGRARDFSRDTRLTEVPVGGNVPATSFVTPAIHGTGEVVVLKVPGRRTTVLISNSYKYVDDMVRVAFSTDQGRRLTSREGFRETLAGLERGGSNMFFYLDPAEARYYLDDQAREEARLLFREEARQPGGFYDQNRPEIERRARQNLFGDRQTPLNLQEQEFLTAEMDRIFVEMTETERARRLPVLEQRIIDDREPLQALEWVSMSLSASRHSVQLLLAGALNFGDPDRGLHSPSAGTQGR